MALRIHGCSQQELNPEGGEPFVQKAVLSGPKQNAENAHAHFGPKRGENAHAHFSPVTDI